jgi:transcriptional regulator with XRE-family HTH domain
LVRAVSEFGSEVKRLLAEQGISLRKAAKLTHYDVSYLSKVVNGHKPGSPELAAAMDKVLEAEGRLAALTRRDGLKASAGSPGMARTSLLSRILDQASDQRHLDAEPLVPVLTGHSAGFGSEGDGPPLDLAGLSAAATDARRKYQACRYSELISQLPDLLARLQAASQALDGDARSRALALAADVYHVAAGLLLKLDDQGLAYLAADRSMQAAQASEEPVTVGASARIMTHALMNGGHFTAAVAAARSHAECLERDVPSHTPESLSVYGSLLLRGAIAAARNDQRSAAHELLDEADETARRLGTDANLRWTAFGPINARLHRVNIAVTLGDAGTAVDVARGTDLSGITVAERKATLLIDTARAYLQWGRHEKAYIALRTAEQVAPEEVAGRPSVHRLVRELAATAPPALRRDAASFAAGIGAASD